MKLFHLKWYKPIYIRPNCSESLVKQLYLMFGTIVHFRMYKWFKINRIMRKLWILFSLVMFSACQDKSEKNLDISEDNQIESFFEEPDAESDKDQNGCLNTAGYTWSSIKNDCVKVYSVGLRLDPVHNQNNEDAQKALYMIFADDAQKVEIYLPHEQKPLILSRQNDANQWVFQRFSLVFQDDLYFFSENELVTFKGAGQIGPRITGSDRMED